METLETIKAKFAMTVKASAPVASKPLQDVIGPDGKVTPGLPWWVVVVNPNRGVPKFYFAYATKEEAGAIATQRNGFAGQAAQDEAYRKGTHVKPFEYFVIEALHGEELAQFNKGKR